MRSRRRIKGTFRMTSTRRFKWKITSKRIAKKILNLIKMDFSTWKKNKVIKTQA